MAKLDAREQLVVWQDVYRAPCQAACPVHTDARTYVTLIAEGRLEAAYWAARETNPLAAVCGRACSAPCEEVCTRGEFDRPIRIRQLKRYLSDRFDMVADSAPIRTKMAQVAVVGAGPAGLAAASELASMGYGVTVFDAAPEAGGTATLGVPRFRLPMGAIEQDVAIVKALGVVFRQGVRVGTDIELQELRSQYAAVFVAAGAMRPNSLNLPGADLAGVIQALPYLGEANLGGRPVTGRKVAVIGGGYTAMDAARTAIRLGAESVTVLYRRTRRETEVHDEELSATVEEGVTMEYLVSPLAMVDDSSGSVAGVSCIRNSLGEPDATGRPRPVPIPGSEFVQAADMVIVAIGQTPEFEAFGFATPPADLRDDDTFMTTMDGVFAGGDFVSGPSTIIEAVADGRRAAAAIDRYLSGSEHPGDAERPMRVLPRRVAFPNGSRLPAEVRALTLDGEVELPLTDDEAIRESIRCLFCGLLPEIEFDECTLCHLCAEICPVQCISRVTVDEGGVRAAAGFRSAVSYDIDDDVCIRCGRCYKVCPTAAIVIPRSQRP